MMSMVMVLGVMAMMSMVIVMVWEEGLVLGAALFTADWAVNGGTSLTTSSGTTTASRAATNGAVTGLLTEAAYF